MTLNALERHVAGATVTHGSPFSALVVPVNGQPLTAEIIQTWVRPLYFGLQTPEAKAFAAAHLHQTTDAIITCLLGDFNWRPRTAAAYLVALTGRSAHTAQLGQLLLRSDVCFAGGAYCLALAALNSPESVGFIDEYLSYYLTRKELWFDQGAAMGALAHLDRLNGTSLMPRHLKAWNTFVENKTNWDLAGYVERFEGSMVTVRALAVV